MLLRHHTTSVQGRQQRRQRALATAAPAARAHSLSHRQPVCCARRLSSRSAVAGAAEAVSSSSSHASREEGSQQQQKRTILLACDDSEESEYAFNWAVQHLHQPGDTFKLMHCIPSLPAGRLVAVPGTGLLRVPRVDPALLAEKAAAEADGALARKFLAHMQASGVQGCFEVLQGPPADSKASISAALCSKTKADGAAAVVIGSASRGGLKEALLGSVAASLVHSCDVPVVVLHKPLEGAAARRDQGSAGQQSAGDVTWLLRASTQEILGAAAGEDQQSNQQQQVKQPRNLVVAIDDSDEGYAAVSWVLRHLYRSSSSDVLHLLHVVPALPAHMSYSLAPDCMMYPLPLPQIEEAQLEESHWRDMLLERFGPLLEANQVQFQLDVLTDYGTDPLQGVAAAVVSTAERLDAAALVVCGHSKGSLAEWLLGSVSDWAVHHSAVPVVVLHGSEFDVDATSTA